MTDASILKVTRADTYTTVVPRTNEPNRIPWDIYYVIPTADKDIISSLFKTAWVIYPSMETVDLMYREWNKYVPGFFYNQPKCENLRNLLMKNEACVMVPTYLNSENQYGYMYSRRSSKTKNVSLGKGLGKLYFLHKKEFVPACSYCPRAAHYLVGDCTPGMNSCMHTFWR
jgi:hypothetical protein